MSIYIWRKIPNHAAYETSDRNHSAVVYKTDSAIMDEEWRATILYRDPEARKSGEGFSIHHQRSESLAIARVRAEREMTSAIAIPAIIQIYDFND